MATGIVTASITAKARAVVFTGGLEAPGASVTLHLGEDFSVSGVLEALQLSTRTAAVANGGPDSDLLSRGAGHAELLADPTVFGLDVIFNKPLELGFTLRNTREGGTRRAAFISQRAAKAACLSGEVGSVHAVAPSEHSSIFAQA